MSYTKMVMVPESSQKADAPLLNQLTTLDGQLQSLLQDRTLPAELQLQKYMQTLQRYQSLKAEQVAPVQQPLEKDLMDTLPPNARNKGRMLLQHVNRHPDKFQWTSDGRLKFEGQPIDGSNFVDLIHHFTRRTPANINIHGTAEFGRLLRETNAPQVALMHGTPMRAQRPQTPGSPSRPGPSRQLALGVEEVKATPGKKKKKESVKIDRPQRVTKPIQRYGADPLDAVDDYY